MPLDSGLQGTRAGCRGQKTKASNIRSSLVTYMWTDRPADSGLDQTHRQAETGGPDRCADSDGRKREGTKDNGQQPSGEAAGHVRSCTVTDSSDRTAPETQRSGCPAGRGGGLPGKRAQKFRRQRPETAAQGSLWTGRGVTARFREGRRQRGHRPSITAAQTPWRPRGGALGGGARRVAGAGVELPCQAQPHGLCRRQPSRTRATPSRDAGTRG